uniref:Uncharacterized protein n=2 Tax=Rhodnius prolixus TaxID=13249 RepID=T1ICS1_RHOPR
MTSLPILPAFFVSALAGS